jgi:hypothetical protein
VEATGTGLWRAYILVRDKCHARPTPPTPVAAADHVSSRAGAADADQDVDMRPDAPLARGGASETEGGVWGEEGMRGAQGKGGEAEEAEEGAAAAGRGQDGVTERKLTIGLYAQALQAARASPFVTCSFCARARARAQRSA